MSPSQRTRKRWGSVRQTNNRLVVVAVLLATFLSALDTSIIGTAMPTVIGQLGGLALYSWVFSAYLLTSTTAVPIYGRLADLYGRKPLAFSAIALFLLGSALCGLAQNMPELVAFRALQGLGAGGYSALKLWPEMCHGDWSAPLNRSERFTLLVEASQDILGRLRNKRFLKLRRCHGLVHIGRRSDH